MERSFCYQIDLVIRLVDTTNGCPVNERRILAAADGRKLTFLCKGEGTYVLLNEGRKDRKLSILVRGYLEAVVEICYEELAENCPEVYVELIPEKPKYGSFEFLDISGNMPGITSIAAVCLTKPCARALSYHAVKRQLKLLEAGRLDEKAYALIHSQTESFEEFHVASVKNRLLLRLAQPLETEVKPKEEISRIVRGRVEKNGAYLLRLREDGRGMQYLIRYEVNGAAKFQKITAESADDWDNGRLQED